jgi:4-hydroxy-3-polyprenylbenzoate decarboxylase
MPFRDNREYIEALEKAGEIVRVEEEVDWDLEAGAIIRRSYEQKLPAPFFQKIKGYPKGFRMFGAPLSNFRRLAIAMDLDPDSHPSVILDEYHQRALHPIKPVVVKDAPCKENIRIGDQVDLYELPAPMVHDGDGGRYISTWHFVITKDLDSDWVNWGMYRQMIHNSQSLGGLFLPTQDIGVMYYRKYEPKNLPMPFATAIGPDPISALCSCASYGVGKSEADLAGGIRRQPVELVKCETSDLLVPAHAEIIIEGEVLPHERVDEGPFGEYTGYRSSPRMPRPVYRVKAITFRNDPILTVANMGMPIDEGDICLSVCGRTDIKTILDNYGFPITGIHLPPECSGHMVVVAVQTKYTNIASHIAHAIWGTKLPYPYVVVVDSDVDAYNITEVLHAIVTKCHPVKGIRVEEHAVGHPLLPFLSLEERMWGKGAAVLFDCTWPLDWPKEIAIPRKASFKDIYPKEIQEKVLNKWQKYGYK